MYSDHAKVATDLQNIRSVKEILRQSTALVYITLYREVGLGLTYIADKYNFFDLIRRKTLRSYDEKLKMHNIYSALHKVFRSFSSIYLEVKSMYVDIFYLNKEIV